MTLTLILPVATTIVERAFSITQSNRRSADKWLLGHIYWERYIQDYGDEEIMQRFQNMKKSQGLLSKQN